MAYSTSLSTSGPASSSGLSIVRYDGAGQEDWSGKTSYLLNKRSPLLITLRASAESPSLFADCSVKLSLRYYDDVEDRAEEPVSYINTFPFEYKTRATSYGKEMEVEAIIHALSSQHVGALFCLLIEVKDNTNQTSYHVTTAPLKVVSKTDSLSVTVSSPEGKRQTLTEMLEHELYKVELNEAINNKMIATLCRDSGVQDKPSLTRSQNLGDLVKRLCSEYRVISKSERGHRLKCEVVGLLDNDLDLLCKVNEAFSESFQEAFDANFETLRSSKKQTS